MMCRLGVFDGSLFMSKESISLMADTFAELERALGGDGNTVMLIGKNLQESKSCRKVERVINGKFGTGEPYSIVHIEPLVGYSNTSYTTYTYGKKNTWRKEKVANKSTWKDVLNHINFEGVRKVLFHTRLTSTGTNELRHPAMGEKWLLFQNGTVRFERAVELYFETEWDTEIVCRMLDKVGSHEKAYEMLLSLNSVWIAVEKASGDIIVIKTTGSLTTDDELTKIVSQGEKHKIGSDSIIHIRANGEILMSENVKKVLDEKEEKEEYTFTGDTYRFYDHLDKDYDATTILLDDGKKFVFSAEGMTCQKVIYDGMSLTQFHQTKWMDMIDPQKSDKEVVNAWREFIHLLKMDLTHEFWVERRSSYARDTELTMEQQGRLYELWVYFEPTGLVISF